MLINCPKCRFSQPDDQYCAQCGVDMHAYRPTQPPIWKKMLLNPLLHTVLIFVLVFIGGLYIQKRQKEQMMARVEFLSGGPLVIEKGAENLSVNSEQALETLAVADDGQATTSAGAAVTPQATLTGPPPPTAAEDKKAGAVKKEQIVGQTKVKITFAEIDSDILKKWIPEIQKSGQFLEFGEANLGVLPNPGQKLSQEKITSLQSFEKVFDGQHRQQSFFSGIKGSDEEADFGINGLVTLIRGDDGKYRAEIEIMRGPQFNESSDKTPRVVNTGDVMLLSKTAVLIWGLLPRKAPEELQEIPSDNVLKIYGSPQFKSGKSEFTLILEFDTPVTP